MSPAAMRHRLAVLAVRVERAPVPARCLLRARIALAAGVLRSRHQTASAAEAARLIDEVERRCPTAPPA